jgi:hypothetical protein
VPAAIEGPAPDWADVIEGATTRDELLGIRTQAMHAGADGARIDALLAARATALGISAKAEQPPADVNALWTQILGQTPDGWTSADVEIDFKKATGVDAGEASAADMQRYLARTPA